MTLEQAKQKAIELSLKQWDRYFHVLPVENPPVTYVVKRYYQSWATHYALKGAIRKHLPYVKS